MARNRTATPSQLLDQLRNAQADHADAIQAANAKLVDEHDRVLIFTNDRRQTLVEQIQLLTAEKAGLDEVAAKAADVPEIR